MEGAVEDKKKAHRERRAGSWTWLYNKLLHQRSKYLCVTGRKAEKKKAKNPHEQEQNARQRNPKAFAIQSVAKAQKRFHRYC